MWGLAPLLECCNVNVAPSSTGAEMPVLLQVVLEVIEENVAQGSRVYEEGHVSLLTSHQNARRQVFLTGGIAG